GIGLGGLGIYLAANKFGINYNLYQEIINAVTLLSTNEYEEGITILENIYNDSVAKVLKSYKPDIAEDIDSSIKLIRMIRACLIDQDISLEDKYNEIVDITNEKTSVIPNFAKPYVKQAISYSSLFKKFHDCIDQNPPDYATALSILESEDPSQQLAIEYIKSTVTYKKTIPYLEIAKHFNSASLDFEKQNDEAIAVLAENLLNIMNTETLNHSQLKKLLEILKPATERHKDNLIKKLIEMSSLSNKLTIQPLLKLNATLTGDINTDKLAEDLLQITTKKSSRTYDKDNTLKEFTAALKNNAKIKELDLSKLHLDKLAAKLKSNNSNESDNEQNNIFTIYKIPAILELLQRAINDFSSGNSLKIINDILSENNDLTPEQRSLIEKIELAYDGKYKNLIDAFKDLNSEVSKGNWPAVLQKLGEHENLLSLATSVSSSSELIGNLWSSFNENGVSGITKALQQNNNVQLMTYLLGEETANNTKGYAKSATSTLNIFDYIKKVINVILWPLTATINSIKNLFANNNESSNMHHNDDASNARNNDDNINENNKNDHNTERLKTAAQRTIVNKRKMMISTDRDTSVPQETTDSKHSLDNTPSSKPSK
ncbi:MAG: hypothetical protein KC414_12505, partial [Romboutsia sp.]|nr:hypothetical protein [Romboutsia sp.]